MMAQAASTDQLIDDYVSVWNEANFDRIPELVSDSFTLYTPAVDEISGPDGLEGLLKGIHGAFSPFSLTLVDRLMSDDIGMAEDILSGTHVGEFRGIPAIGNDVEIHFMDKYRFEDGKLEEHRVFYNVPDFVSQLSPETE